MSRFLLMAILVGLCANSVRGVEPSADQVLKETGIHNGLCVVVGAGDAAQLKGLSDGGRILVHALVTDKAVQDKLREAVAAAGGDGAVTIDSSLDPKHLPYIDNLANVVVADLDAAGAKGPSLEEVLRVVCPRGTAYVKQKGAWTKTLKPRPAGMDEWTHFGHNADGNTASGDELVKPSTGIQWMAGPSSIGGDGSNCMYLHDGVALEFCMLPNEGPERWTGASGIVARDAYNGTLRWYSEPAFAFNMQMFAGGGRFYRPSKDGYLEALSLETGKRTMLYDKGFKLAPPFKASSRKGDGMETDKRLLNTGNFTVYHQERILMSEASEGTRLLCLDAKTGDLLWQAKAEGGVANRVLALGNQVMWIINKNAEYADYVYDQRVSEAKEIVCFNLATGRELWRNRDVAGKYLVYVAVGNGSFVACTYLSTDKFPERNFMTSIDLATGKTNFAKNSFAFKRYGRNCNMRLAVIKNGIYMIANAWFAGYDLHTGKDLLENCVPAGIGQFECFVYTATPNYIINNIHIFTDLTGKVAPNSPEPIVRMGCWGSYAPANGLLYCAADGRTSNVEHHLMTMASLTGTPPPAAVPDALRLEKGPGNAGVKPAQWPGKDAWPIHLGNPARSRQALGTIPGKPKEAWKVKIATPNDAGFSTLLAKDWNTNDWSAGRITAPTAADGLVFLAVPEAHRVEAHDAASGAETWRYTTGGRIDSPPTLYGGLCLFGSADGWVYAVNAADGKLVWRFFAALCEQRIEVFSQVESSTPVHGTVLIHNGVLFVVAGRQAHALPNTVVWQLDPLTGKVLWKHIVDPKEVVQPVVGLTQSDGTVVQWGFNVVDQAGNKILPGQPEKRTPVVLQPTGEHRLRFLTPVSLDKVYGLGEIRSPRAEYNLWYSEDSWHKNGRCIAQRIAYDAKTLALYQPRDKENERGMLSLWKLDANGDIGANIWKLDAKACGHLKRTAGLAIVGDRVLMATNSDDLTKSAVVVFSAADGAKLGEATFASAIVTDGLAVADGKVYVSTADGVLHGLAE